MKKKVLIGYTEYGFQSKSVSDYIKSYFINKNEYEVMALNINEYSNNKIISNLNNNSFIYRMFNNRISNKVDISSCIKLFDNDNLRDAITSFNPDIIISTHFYVNYVFSFYNDINLIKTNIISVVVSSKHLEWWVVNKANIDAFVVKNEFVKNELIKYNVESSKIYAFGIPVNRCLSEDILSKDLILKRYSLTDNKPVYLLFASDNIFNDYFFEYFKILVNKKYSIQLILITGNNRELKLKCENYILKNEFKNVLVLSFLKDIYNLINISEAVITKPNSEILYKCLEMKKPCILIPGISSQELKNSKYMIKNHYGTKVRGPRSLARKVKLFLNYPFLINSMKNKLLKLSDKEAIINIYELTCKMLKDKKK